MDSAMEGCGRAIVIPFARPGALAKAVFVAIACVEAIALCRLRKLVSTVSCCGALKDAQCRRATQSCGNCIPTISFLCYVNAV
jgi:hypothetical protein